MPAPTSWCVGVVYLVLSMSGPRACTSENTEAIGCNAKLMGVSQFIGELLIYLVPSPFRGYYTIHALHLCSVIGSAPQRGWGRPITSADHSSSSLSIMCCIYCDCLPDQHIFSSSSPSCNSHTPSPGKQHHNTSILKSPSPKPSTTINHGWLLLLFSRRCL